MRRQSLRKTRAGLRRSLGPDDREWVMDAWQAAEGIFTQLSLLSPLTTALGLSYAESYAAAEGLTGDEIQQAFFVVMMAGYATRTVVAGSTEQPSLDRSALPVGDGTEAADVARDPALIKELLDPVARMAFAEFGSVMTLPPAVWAGYVSMATLQLQRNLASRNLMWRQFSTERIEGMLRYGYVLRLLDEALDGEPKLRDDSPYAPQQTGHAELSTEALSTMDDEEVSKLLYDRAVIAHTTVMSDEAEREVGGGPFFVAGEATWEGWTAHERDAAIITCRMGLMVRMAELELLPGASDFDPNTVIPILELVQKMVEQANVGEAGLTEDEQRARIETATIASANSFVATREMSDAILALTPGTTAVARRGAFRTWIALAGEKGMAPAGLSAEDHERMMVYGYALGVIRELLMGVQQPNLQR